MRPSALVNRALLAFACISASARAGEPPPKPAPAAKPAAFRDPLELLRAVAGGRASLHDYTDARRGVLEVHFEVYAAVKSSTWSSVLCADELGEGLRKFARQIAIFVEQSPACDAASCAAGGDEAGPRTTFRFRRGGARGLTLDEVDYQSVVNPPGFDEAHKKFMKDATTKRKPCPPVRGGGR